MFYHEITIADDYAGTRTLQFQAAAGGYIRVRFSETTEWKQACRAGALLGVALHAGSTEKAFVAQCVAWAKAYEQAGLV